jgi:PGF-CTERM protein
MSGVAYCPVLMKPTRSVRLAATSLLMLAVLAGAVPLGVVGVADASHGPESANYTVEPMGDRSPGAESVRYGQRVVATAGTDLATLEQTTATYREGSFSSCGPNDGETFGIDRGSTQPPYGIDHDLQENVKSFTAREDLFKVEFYGENDFGASTHLDDGDEFISVATCLDNPDQPGWYRISGTTTGVTDSGHRVTFSTESHYFWICNCEDEADARQQVGPPPSEPRETATPTSGGTDGDGSDGGTADESGTDDAEQASPQLVSQTPTGTPPSDGATATPAATAEPGDAQDDTASDTADTPTARPASHTEEWNDHVLRTPTAAEGPGFGPVPALVAILAAVPLLGRRR